MEEVRGIAWPEEKDAEIEVDEVVVEQEKAVKEKKQTVQWEETEIPIEDAEKFIKTAKKQFENPNKPVKQEKKTDHEVLIIKENAELTEFIQKGELLNRFNLTYSSIDNLSAGLELKKHQMGGVAWLQTLLKEKQPGGLLADDMGLGKT